MDQVLVGLNEVDFDHWFSAVNGRDIVGENFSLTINLCIENHFLSQGYFAANLVSSLASDNVRRIVLRGEIDVADRIAPEQRVRFDQSQIERAAHWPRDRRSPADEAVVNEIAPFDKRVRPGLIGGTLCEGNCRDQAFCQAAQEARDVCPHGFQFVTSTSSRNLDAALPERQTESGLAGGRGGNWAQEERRRERSARNWRGEHRGGEVIQKLPFERIFLGLVKSFH